MMFDVFLNVEFFVYKNVNVNNDQFFSTLS